LDLALELPDPSPCDLPPDGRPRALHAHAAVGLDHDAVPAQVPTRDSERDRRMTGRARPARDGHESEHDDSDDQCRAHGPTVARTAPAGDALQAGRRRSRLGGGATRLAAPTIDRNAAT